MKVENLHTKYLEDKLTTEELSCFRKEIGQLSDDELAQRMAEEWISGNFETDNVSAANIRKIRRQLSADLHPVLRFVSFHTLLRVAAILLIPLLVFTSYYFYRESVVVSSHDMVVSAGKGEKVSVILPDGSKIRINAMSTLSYNPAKFNKANRRVQFEGEAFFDVAHNGKVPFQIATKDMDLEVLGTTFNLRARDYEENIEILLFNGHVLLTSLSSHNEQELFENQKAYLCKQTGLFTVIKESAPIVAPWLSEEIIFKDTPLEEVIRTIENHFDITFSFIACDTLGKDHFTGTLPSNDLDEVLEILQKSYHFTYEKKAKSIKVFSK